VPSAQRSCRPIESEIGWLATRFAVHRDLLPRGTKETDASKVAMESVALGGKTPLWNRSRDPSPGVAVNSGDHGTTEYGTGAPNWALVRLIGLQKSRASFDVCPSPPDGVLNWNMPYQSLIDDMSLAGCPVVLVCREFEGDENLGVRYLANALSQAGIDFKLFALNQVADIDRIASQVLELHALLVGISLSDNNVALDLLSFVEYLRFRGYRGQIVAGGALATVQRHHILAHHSGIDSIVRLQGEHALVKLARCIIDNSPIEMVPGLTTRAGDGTPVVDSAALFTCRPLRDTQLPTALGVSTARLIASRGCSGHCVYCGSTALRHIASSEARRAGWSTERIVKAGIGARRTRPLSDFADEVAELYHARGVRFFHLHDDNILGPHEMPALDWLHTVQQYLD